MRARRSCRWWESARDFDSTLHYTGCYGADNPLDGENEELAALCWKVGPGHCPFCGAFIDYCDENEVIDEYESENEFREGVRYGWYGY